MVEPVAFLDRSGPAARRLWLLAEALRSEPFDRAVELARSAEAFITADQPGAVTKVAVTGAEPQADDVALPGLTLRPGTIQHAPTKPIGRTGLGLSCDDRDHLLGRSSICSPMITMDGEVVELDEADLQPAPLDPENP